MTFDEFVAENFDKLSRYARLLTGNREDAEDLLAESLFAAGNRWKSIASMEFPHAYVRRMVSSRYLDGQRSWFNRRVEIVDPTKLVLLSGPAPDDQQQVTDQLALSALLAALPANQRDCPGPAIPDAVGICGNRDRTRHLTG